MKATETQLLKFVQGTNQFRVPIYQRTYSWTADQCWQLWQDILRAAKGNEVEHIDANLAKAVLDGLDGPTLAIGSR